MEAEVILGVTTEDITAAIMAEEASLVVAMEEEVVEEETLVVVEVEEAMEGEVEGAVAERRCGHWRR